MDLPSKTKTDLPVGSRDHSGIYSLKGRISGRPGETVRLRIATDEQITREFPDKSGYCRSDGEVAHVAAKYAAKYRRPVESISPEALRRLLDCDWPGNVRELENCIERAVLVARGKSIAVADLPDTVRAASGVSDTPASSVDSTPAADVTNTVALTDAPLSVQLRDFEKRLLEYTLEKTKGNYAAAARQLGVSPRMMYYRARGVGIGRTPSAT